MGLPTPASEYKCSLLALMGEGNISVNFSDPGHLSFWVITYHSIHSGPPLKILQETLSFTGMDHVASTWNSLHNLKIHPPWRLLNLGYCFGG